VGDTGDEFSAGSAAAVSRSKNRATASALVLHRLPIRTAFSRSVSFDKEFGKPQARRTPQFVRRNTGECGRPARGAVCHSTDGADGSVAVGLLTEESDRRDDELPARLDQEDQAEIAFE
jgi:hypothetical protein